MSTVANVSPLAGRRTRTVLGKTILYAVCMLLTVVSVFPFVWMVSTSFKTLDNTIIIPPQWIPRPFAPENYAKIFEYIPFLNMLFNSTYITTLVVLGRLFVCALSGYAFARMHAPGKNLAFGFLIAALMVPLAVNIIPMYLGFKAIGWIDTHWTLIIPGIFPQTFGTFLLRQFFLTLPGELEEAARMDGASAFGIFWRIFLPLAKPALAALAIFTFTGTWNQFLEPLVYLSTKTKFTVTVGLAWFQADSSGSTAYNLLMGTATMVVIPIIIMYAAFQKYFTQGIALTGLKG